MEKHQRFDTRIRPVVALAAAMLLPALRCARAGADTQLRDPDRRGRPAEQRLHLGCRPGRIPGRQPAAARQKGILRRRHVGVGRARRPRQRRQRLQPERRQREAGQEGGRARGPGPVHAGPRLRAGAHRLRRRSRVGREEPVPAAGARHLRQDHPRERREPHPLGRRLQRLRDPDGQAREHHRLRHRPVDDQRAGQRAARERHHLRSDG